MAVNFDLDATGGDRTSSFSPNYFHMLDEALVFHTIDLSAVNAAKKNKTFLVKELLTMDGEFNKTLFEFLNWIISENDREIFLAKTCHIKFIHTKANQDLLKIFVHADSRCLLNLGHKIWVSKCFNGWKKKCVADKKTAEVDKVDRMIREIDEVFGQNAYDTDDSTITFDVPRTPKKVSPEKPALSKKMSKSNMENEAPHPFDPETDVQSPPPQQQPVHPPYYHGPPPQPMDATAYYGGYPPPMPQYPVGYPPRPHVDMDLYFAAELGREMVHRKSMTFNGGSTLFNMGGNDLDYKSRELELLKSSKDIEIMNLKRELAMNKSTAPFGRSQSAKHAHESHYDTYDGVAVKDSMDADDSTVDGRDAEFNEQKRLEKALRDMMDYYDKALLAKDEQINSLQQELTTKADHFAETMMTNMQALEEARKFYINDLETNGKSSTEAEDRLQKEMLFMKQSYEKLIAANEEKEAELRNTLEEKNEKLERAFARIRKTLKDRTEEFTSEKADMIAEMEKLRHSVANNDADKAALVQSNKEAMDRLKDELDVKLAQCERNFNVERELVELEKKRLEREMREIKEVLSEKDAQVQRATEKHTADLEERARVVERYENLLNSKEADYNKYRRDMVLYNEKLATIDADKQKAIEDTRNACALAYEERRLQLEEEIRSLKDGQKNFNVHTTKKLQQELEKTIRAHETDLKFHAAAFNDERNRLKLRMQSLKENYEAETKSLRQQLLHKTEQLSQVAASSAASLDEFRSSYLREIEAKSSAIDSEKYAIGKELSDLQEKYRLLKEEMEVVINFEQERTDYIQELEAAVEAFQQENMEFELELAGVRERYFQQKESVFGQYSTGAIALRSPAPAPIPSVARKQAAPAPVPSVSESTAQAVPPPVKKAIMVDNYTQISVPIMSATSTQTDKEAKEAKPPSAKKLMSVETKVQEYMPSNINRTDSFSFTENVERSMETSNKSVEYMSVSNQRDGSTTPVSVSPTREGRDSNSYAFTQYVNMPRESILKSHSIADSDMDSQAESDEFPLKVSLGPVKKSITVKVPKAAIPAPVESTSTTDLQSKSPSSTLKGNDKLQQRNADVQKAKMLFQQKLMATEALISTNGDAAPVQVVPEKKDAPVVVAPAAPVNVSEPTMSQSTRELCTRFSVQQPGIFDGGRLLKRRNYSSFY